MPDMRKALEEEIAKALAVGQDDPNISEACTCDWIVRPLLEAAGYTKTEIVPQAIDGANQFPDYTILPQHQATWFLEAKSWKTKLTDSHAQQAINYANQNGKRWVVLTNGRQWRLYDNYIVGVAAAGKLVACIELEDVEAATAFLTALGRHSMTSGGAEDYAITAQLAAALDQELADPDSQVIKAICSKLKTRPGLGSLTREQIASYFRRSEAPPAVAPLPVEQRERRPSHVPAASHLSKSVAANERYSLEELDSRRRELVTHRKPVATILPDGTEVATRAWKDVALSVVRWLAANDKLPELPWVAGNVRARYFLNTEPRHPDPSAKHIFEAVEVNDRTVYVDKHRSGENLISQLVVLLSSVGLSGPSALVRLHPRS